MTLLVSDKAHSSTRSRVSVYLCPADDKLPHLHILTTEYILLLHRFPLLQATQSLDAVQRPTDETGRGRYEIDAQ
jgi:hypothetical protein